MESSTYQEIRRRICGCLICWWLLSRCWKSSI